MTQSSYPDTLALSRRVLRVLIPVNKLIGVLIFVLLIASLVASVTVFTALGTKPTSANYMMQMGMRMIMVIGILGIPLTHVVLTRLLAIVETVGVGDAFMIENADRLQTIAWAVLGLQILHLAVGLIIKLVSTGAQLDIDWSFSFTPWLAILLLFVLARVFEQGARMREELQGTV
jgi:hypothetical protein